MITHIITYYILPLLGAINYCYQRRIFPSSNGLNSMFCRHHARKHYQYFSSFSHNSKSIFLPLKYDEFTVSTKYPNLKHMHQI